MIIGGLQKTTLIDYPGKIAATVFLCGCNFRCPWCYAPHLVLPEEIKKQIHPVRKNFSNGAKISEKEFFDFLKERKGLLEGVVICGGEPTLQEDLSQFVGKIKKLGFFVKLDTNGSNPEMLEDLIDKKLLDYIAMDIKAPLENSKYEKATGGKIDLDKIKKSIEIIKNSGVDYEFRTTVVPGVHSKEDILKIAREISQPTRLRASFAEVASATKAEQGFGLRPTKSPSADAVGGQGKYYLQNFRPEKTIGPKFKNIKPYPQEFLLEIKKAIAPFFDVCQIR